MSHGTRRPAIVLTLSTAAVFAACSEAPRSPATGPSTIEDTVVHPLTSSAGHDYLIHVALPRSYAESRATYPTLYLLDSDVLFGLVTDVTRLLPLDGAFLGRERVPELIVVGVGYPGGSAELASTRGRDYNSPGTGTPTGAEDFYRFLTGEVVSLVEATYRADPADRTLLGASRGGLFVVSTLLQHPDAFQRWVAISPILEPSVFELEASHAATAEDLPARLFLSAGTGGGIESGIAADVEHLARALRDGGYPGFTVTTRRYDGESHASVVPGALVDGLLAVFDRPAV